MTSNQNQMILDLINEHLDGIYRQRQAHNFETQSELARILLKEKDLYETLRNDFLKEI